MKNMKMKIFAIAVLLFLSITATAQKGTLKFNINYNYGIPVGAFKGDLVNDPSPRGARGSLMYSFDDQLSAGLESGYQNYYQKYPRQTYSIGKTQDLSAVLTNSIQTTPFILKGNYFPLQTVAVKPYVSLGVGANLIDFKQYFGEFGSGQTQVGFMAQGGLGVLIPFGKMHTSGVTLGAAYEYAPYNKNGYHDLNSINLRAGVIFEID